jgi:S-adenosyl methyltransferase
MARHRPVWAPDEIDIERPSAARMYDYYLGGSHNFPADRELARQYMQVLPDMPAISWANRAFLRRAVTYLARDVGLDQFLDLGSGIPTGGNVHEIVAALNPHAHVVYVDADPVAAAHAVELLAAVPTAAALHADLREPDIVLGAAVDTGLVDLSRPLAVLTVAVLHFVPDQDDPGAVLSVYREATAPSSHLVISHATNEYHPETAQAAEEVYSRASHGMTFRSRAEIAALTEGYELLPPGLVDAIRWRPDPQGEPGDPLGGDVTRYNLLAAVGRR